MSLVTVAEIYERARKGGYGVAGFCVEGLGTALAILDAAEEAQAPVVAVIWQENIRSVGPGYLEAIVKHGASRVKVPVAIMLDHGTDLGICLESIVHGHSAVMIDASHYSFEENIRRTCEVCDLAHLLNVTVEGELGAIRRTFEKTGEFAVDTTLTDPSLVPIFVERTGVDALAVSIGTESGILDRPPELDFERLSRIRAKSDVHLVIHGGSGTPPDDVRRVIACGATAFRFASEMWLAYLEAIKKAQASLPPNFPDTRNVFGPARAAAKDMVLARIEQLGCAGKAW
jgi:fructose-bisphosphate aldolase, class II